MNKADRNKGFSLIELVITIAIMGIVVLISVNLNWMINKALNYLRFVARHCQEGMNICYG